MLEAEAQPGAPWRVQLRNATLLLASSLTVMAAAIISPALPQIEGAFAGEANASLLTQLALTAPALLIASADAPKYVTLVENNHADATGAITLHIIEIGTERYRGAIKPDGMERWVARVLVLTSRTEMVGIP